MPALDWITIEGFKSIKRIERLRLGPINVLIGANGSGKSNFIEVFSFLCEVRARRLQERSASSGATRGPMPISTPHRCGRSDRAAQAGRGEVGPVAGGLQPWPTLEKERAWRSSCPREHRWGARAVNLIVHVEGHTEDSFVNELLDPHLRSCGFSTVRAGFIGGMQGGITSWTLARQDIVNHLQQDRACIATTMVDYYGLPRAGPSAWPERARASTLPFVDKAGVIESALSASVGAAMGPDFDQSPHFGTGCTGWSRHLVVRVEGQARPAQNRWSSTKFAFSMLRSECTRAITTASPARTMPRRASSGLSCPTASRSAGTTRGATAR